MAWAATILTHTDVLQAYEEGLQEQEMEEPPLKHTTKQIPQPTLPMTKPENQTAGKGKGKMPPMGGNSQTHSNK